MFGELDELGFHGDAPPLPPDATEGLGVDVPTHLEVLPDGREAVVFGDVEGCKEFNHTQGDNPFGFTGTCGLVSCEGVLRQFGIEVTEADVVQYAMERGYCSYDWSWPPELCGGTSQFTQAEILEELGVPAHVEFLSSQERLADLLERGHSVIIEVNAGELWDQAGAWDGGRVNHAVVVTGTARDPSNGALLGFFVNDSGGSPPASGRFIPAEQMSEMWDQAHDGLTGAGASCVVTDGVRPAYSRV